MAPVLRNLGWLLAGKGVGAVLSLVYLALAARRLGPSQFGQFTLVLGTAQAIAALVGFQSWQIVVRFGAAHLHGDGGQERLSRLVGFCVGIDLAAASAGCLLAWCGVLLLGPALGWSPELARGALLFSAASLLSVRSTAVGVLRLLDRFRIGALADATTPIVRFCGALVSVACGATLRGFLLAWAAAEIATALAYWIAARRIGGSSVRLPHLADLRAAPADNPGLWRFTWTTNLALSLETGTRQVAVLLVGLVTGAVTAGNYRLAAQLSQSIVRVSDMAARAIFAEAARGGAPIGVRPGGTSLPGGTADGQVPGGKPLASDARTGGAGDAPSLAALTGGAWTSEARTSEARTGGASTRDRVGADVPTRNAPTGDARIGDAPARDAVARHAMAGNAASGDAAGGKVFDSDRWGGRTASAGTPGSTVSGLGDQDPHARNGYALAATPSGGNMRTGDTPDTAGPGGDARHRDASGGGASDPARLLRHVTRLALAAAAGLAVVLSLGRYGLLLLGGRAHLDAYPLLRLLAIAAAIDLAGVGFEPVLMAMGQATRTLALRGLVAFLLLAALALLLPRFGGIGAASATVISSAAGFVLFGLAARACVRSASATAVKPSARERAP